MEMTPRQGALYSILLNNPDIVFKQSEIAIALAEYYQPRNIDNFHNTTARIMLTDDIRAINDNDEIQKIIISDKAGVRLASRDEYQKKITAEFAAIFRKLERTRKKAKKAGLDGQIRFTEGRERDTVEAFSDSVNRLKAARLAKHLRLVDVVPLLEQSCIDVPLLSKMEKGYCQPTNETLVKLAEIYGVSVEALKR